MVWKWVGSSQDGGVNWTSCLGHRGAHTAEERGVGAVSEIKAKRFGGQLNASPTNLQQCSSMGFRMETHLKLAQRGFGPRLAIAKISSL